MVGLASVSETDDVQAVTVAKVDDAKINDVIKEIILIGDESGFPLPQK